MKQNIQTDIGFIMLIPAVVLAVPYVFPKDYGMYRGVPSLVLLIICAVMGSGLLVWGFLRSFKEKQDEGQE